MPAVMLDGGHQIDLYTGEVTVRVYGNARRRVRRAVAALRRTNAEHPGAGEPLPAPIRGALTGRIDCGYRFDALAVTTTDRGKGPRAIFHVALRRKSYVDVQLERREGGRWVSGAQAVYRARAGATHHAVPIRHGRYRATVTAWDRGGRRTRVRTLRFRTSPSE